MKSIRALSISSGLLYAGFYLFATGLASYYPGTDLTQYYAIPSVRVSLNGMLGWSPWIDAYPTNNIIVSLPFWALLSTMALSFLLACNVALMSYAHFKTKGCGRKALSVGLMGAIPASFWAAVGCCNQAILFFISAVGLTSLMLKAVPFLTIGSIVLLSAGIYLTAKGVVYSRTFRE